MDGEKDARHLAGDHSVQCLHGGVLAEHDAAADLWSVHVGETNAGEPARAVGERHRESEIPVPHPLYQPAVLFLHPRKRRKLKRARDILIAAELESFCGDWGVDDIGEKTIQLWSDAYSTRRTGWLSAQDRPLRWACCASACVPGACTYRNVQTRMVFGVRVGITQMAAAAGSRQWRVGALVDGAAS